MFSVMLGNIDVTQTLLNEGADINYTVQASVSGCDFCCCLLRVVGVCCFCDDRAKFVEYFFLLETV